MIEKSGKRFKKAYVEITNVCNLACDFCIKTTRQKQFVSLENFRHVARQVSQFTDYIYLHVMGEPLLHNDLCGIIDIANEYELHVNITTNGTLIGQNVDMLKEKNIRKIAFSLHSYGGNGADSCGEYLQNILSATDILSKKIICELRFWNGDSQGKNDENAFILKQIEKHFGCDNGSLQDFQGGVKLLDKIYIGSEKRFVWPNLAAKDISRDRFCLGLRDQFAVLVCGTVVPCCLDSNGDISLGNIYEQSLADILQGQRAENIYQGFSNRQAVERLCQKCEFRLNG